jgi:ABC-type sugar transport system ATPase subunit
MDPKLVQGADLAPVPRAEVAISARGVEKVYGSTIALGGADLVTRSGEIHALLGENGAGKSTMVRILAGVEQPDSGEVRIFGRDPAEVAAAGDAAFIHQDLALFPTMSVATNIALSVGFRRRLGLIDDVATVAAAREVLDRLGMRIDPRAAVGELPLAAQTVVAIARALAHGVRLIVLDEPTAYLEAAQVQGVLKLLARLRDEGVACLLITHRAGDVISVCDRITVFRDGRTVAVAEATGQTEGSLVEMISGEVAAETAAATRRSRRGGGKEVLSLRDAGNAAFGPLSLEVGEGEVVGVCGLADAGAFEVGKGIFGITEIEFGEIRLNGERIEPLDSPAEAIDLGIAYVPPERRTAGVAETLTARENVFMRPRRRAWEPIVAAGERDRAHELMKRVGVQPPNPEHIISTFSGGNQQKIVLAKWFDQNPALIVLNEPTAGVDLAAKADIHARVREMCAEQSLAVLLISSDFSEVADYADRIYVMRHKVLVEEVAGAESTAEHLVALAYGGVSV